VKAEIKKLATAHPNVTTAIACKGTTLESTTYNTNNKAFLFVRPLADSLELRLKAAGAWIKVTVPAAGPLPKTLAGQIAESYAAFEKPAKAAPKKKR
jgi:hypothetical protein